MANENLQDPEQVVTAEEPETEVAERVTHTAVGRTSATD